MNVHEMFYSAFHAISGFSSISEIEDEARIAHGFSPKPRWRHVVPAEELLDGAQNGHCFCSPRNGG
jgi:hypothetical protein